MALIVFHVQDDNGRPLAGATLSATSPLGDWMAATNPCGDCLTQLGAGHYTLTVSAPGCQSRTLEADLGNPGIVTIGLDRAGSSQPLAGLAVRGACQFFTTSAGDPLTIIEASDFALYQRFLDGEDISLVLTERHEVGFNTVRVFGMYFGSLGRFVPGDYGDEYYARLPAFFGQLANAQLIGEFTAFADCGGSTPPVSGVDAQLRHWDRIVAALRYLPNALLEAVNEADQPANRLASLNRLPRPEGCLASHGSNGSQAWPVSPPWDYETFHTNDAPEWWRKVGHNAMEIADARYPPVLSNENTRAPDRFTSPTQAFDAAAGAALLCAGSCFHSVSGKASVLWTGEEFSLARAWANGARSVDLKYQAGQYRHRQDLETPDLLRVYSRILSDGDEWVVKIRR